MRAIVSRYGTQNKIMSSENMKTSQLPSLDSPCSLSSEDITSFQRDGYLALPQVINREEMAAYRSMIHEALQQKDNNDL